MTRSAAAIVVTGVLLGIGHSVVAQEWPQWRGPGRDGAVLAANTPAAWPESFTPQWRVETGEGYSSPVVSGGRVFVHSRRDPQEIVTAIDLASGKVIWQQTQAATYEKNQYAVRMGKGPNATPLVSGGRLFTLGATALLTAWDAPTGKRLWQHDFSNMVNLSKLFCGTAASPLLAGGLLIVQVGSDVGGGMIAAFDPATGAKRWEWKGAGPGYASPNAIEVAGVRQIVTLTNQSVLGLDAGTGRELWSVPFPDEWHENIVTPIWTGTHLIVSGTRQGTQGYTLTRTGTTWQARQQWKNTQASMYTSTPVLADGVLYGLSDKRKGYFVAIDAATGAVKWQTEGREGANATVVLTASHVLYLTESADLTVVRRDTGRFALERKYDLGTSETWTMPVVIGRDLLIKDATSVVRLAGR